MTTPSTDSTDNLRHKLNEVILSQQKSTETLQKWFHDNGRTPLGTEMSNGSGLFTPETSTIRSEEVIAPMEPANDLVTYDVRKQLLEQLIGKIRRPHFYPSGSYPFDFALFWVTFRGVLRSIGYPGFVTQFEAGDYSLFRSWEDDALIRGAVLRLSSFNTSLYAIEKMVRQTTGDCTAGLLLNAIRKKMDGKPVGPQYYRKTLQNPFSKDLADSLLDHLYRIDVIFLACQWNTSIPENEIAGTLYASLDSKYYSEFKEWVGGPPSTVQEYKAKLIEYAQLPEPVDYNILPDKWNIF